MKVLVDANVVLDVILGREPWLDDSAVVLAAAAEDRVEGYLAAHTVTTVHYLVESGRDRRVATAATVELLEIFDIVPVTRDDFHRALTLDLPDFEDAVQGACALRVGADYVVTRDEAGFRDLPIPAVPPGALVAMLR